MKTSRFHGGYRGEREVVDFSVNINPLAPPGFLLELIGQCLSTVKQYPDWEYKNLRKNIGILYGLDPGLIYPSNGASQGLFSVLHYIKPESIVQVIPSYGDYIDYAFSMKTCLYEFPMIDRGRSFELDWEGLLSKVKEAEKPVLVIVVNPVNPTGTLFGRKELDDFIVRIPEDCYLLLDEAYMDLATGEFTSAYNDIENVFVVKSLTKSLGIPGLRIGFTVGWRKDVKGLWSTTGSWQVNSVADCAISKAVESRLDELKIFLRRSKEIIDAERVWLEEKLSKLGFQVYSSRTNFLLIRHDWIRTQDLVQAMLGKGIYLRRGDTFSGLGHSYTRVAVRLREDNVRLVEAFEKVL